jgi:hypothetical protein
MFAMKYISIMNLMQFLDVIKAFDIFSYKLN